MTEATHINPRTGLAFNPKQAIPVLLALFVFSLIMDNGFKLMSPSIASSLGLSENTVSLQATLPGLSLIHISEPTRPY